MNSTIGYIRERLGKTVYKAMLLRSVGEDKDGRKKWRVLKQRYFKPNETFWEYKGQPQDKAFELNLSDECYGRGEVHVHFIDFDTGNALNMNGAVIASEHPEVLKRMVSVKHIKTFAENVRGSNFTVVWFLVGFAIGGLLFFMIGQNWLSIVSRIGGG